MFGVGNPNADLMFIGEGPGFEEDRQGIPFVGPAGQLLTKIINAIDLSRDDVYITNVVKCRPPRNRDPEPVEVEECRPFLDRPSRSLAKGLLSGFDGALGVPTRSSGPHAGHFVEIGWTALFKGRMVCHVFPLTLDVVRECLCHALVCLPIDALHIL